MGGVAGVHASSRDSAGAGSAEGGRAFPPREPGRTRRPIRTWGVVLPPRGRARSAPRRCTWWGGGGGRKALRGAAAGPQLGELRAPGEDGSRRAGGAVVTKALGCPPNFSAVPPVFTECSERGRSSIPLVGMEQGMGQALGADTRFRGGGALLPWGPADGADIQGPSRSGRRDPWAGAGGWRSLTIVELRENGLR